MNAIMLWLISRVVPTGAGMDWFAATAPSGAWLLRDGSAVSRTTFARLFAVIGTTYGVGDGSTTFNVPDDRGRVSVGLGTHADVSTLGNSDGLAVGNRRPKHKHTVNDPGHTHTARSQLDTPITGSGGAAYQSSGQTSSATTGITIGPQTGAEPTDAPAYIVVNRIIKT